MSQQPVSPPKFSAQLLHWSLPKELKEPVMGDLDEEFIQHYLTDPAKATNWYRNQALRSALQFIWKTKRGLLMFLVSILVFLAVAVMGMELGIELSAYLDVPSLLLVVLPAIFFAIAATNFSSLKLGLRLLVNDELEADKLELMQAKQAFTVMGNTAVLTGIFSTLMGGIAIAGNIQAEEFNKVFGPALAVCFLTLYYGFGLKVLTYVSEQKLQFKIDKLAN